jgi:hypothetical protein
MDGFVGRKRRWVRLEARCRCSDLVSQVSLFIVPRFAPCLDRFNIRVVLCLPSGCGAPLCLLGCGVLPLMLCLVHGRLKRTTVLDGCQVREVGAALFGYPAKSMLSWFVFVCVRVYARLPLDCP